MTLFLYASIYVFNYFLFFHIYAYTVCTCLSVFIYNVLLSFQLFSQKKECIVQSSLFLAVYLGFWVIPVVTMYRQVNNHNITHNGCYGWIYTRSVWGLDQDQTPWVHFWTFFISFPVHCEWGGMLTMFQNNNVFYKATEMWVTADNNNHLITF